jgi:hypothetical protein
MHLKRYVTNAETRITGSLPNKVIFLDSFYLLQYHQLLPCLRTFGLCSQNITTARTIFAVPAYENGTS